MPERRTHKWPSSGTRAAPGSRRIVLAAAGTAILLCAVFVAAERGAPRLGFLLWFRHEGRGVDAEGVALLVVFAAAVTLMAGAFAGAGGAAPVALLANTAMKLALLAAVAFMLAHPDLPQFENKSLTLRAVFYPLLALSVPILYRLRGAQGPYPALLDLAWSFTLTLDIVSNDLHWYGNWKHWDDVVHFVNSIPLAALIIVFLLALERRGRIRLGFWGASAVAIAVYAALHNQWQINEFLMDRFAGTELQPGGMAEATRNNLWGVAGSVGALCPLLYWKREGVLDDVFVVPLATLVFGAQAATGDVATRRANINLKP